MRYASIQNSSPLRPTNWRWFRAEQLVGERCHYSRKRGDPLTGEAVHYLQARRQARSARQLERVDKRFPLIQAALAIYEEGGQRKSEIEGRILAGQTSDEIAACTGVPSDVIDKYEALFFCVRDRLKARDWIVGFAIGMQPFSLAPIDDGVILKRFAYFGGVLVLEALLPHLFGGTVAPADLSTTEGRLTQLIGLNITLQRLPDDDFTGWKLSKIQLLLAEEGLPRCEPGDWTAILAQNADHGLEKLAQEAAKGARQDADSEPPTATDREAA